jgi:rhomboid protease GluP
MRFPNFLDPVKGIPITLSLIIINVLLFGAMVSTGVNIMAPDNESLLAWGANFRPMTLDGEYWRLLSSCFLHIGILHLAMNMYALLYIGFLLEPLLGKTRFVTAYLLTGLLASLNSLWWHELTVSAGASGAVFGMYGVFLALLTTNLIEKTTRKDLLSSIGIFVAYNLMFGLKDGIDNAAHLGGLISGLVFGYAFVPGLMKPANRLLKYLVSAGLIIIVLITIYFVINKIPNTIAIYQKNMETFGANESMALEIFKLPENTPKEKILNQIQTRGLYYWEENIRLLKENEKMELSDEIQRRNKILIRYCELRIKTYTLIYKTVEEDTERYQDSLKLLNTKLENILKELEGEK